MPVFNFDLQDGKPPVSFALALDDADRMVAFMETCSRAIAGAGRMKPALLDACDLLDGWVNTKCPARFRQEHRTHIDKLRFTANLHDA